METIEFVSFDQQLLQGYAYKAEKEKAVLHFIHGASDRVDRYEDFALYLNELGISFYALDQRGHGKSETRRGPYVYLEPGDHERMIQDNVFFYRWIKEQTSSPVYLLGHSFGSLLARVLVTRVGGYEGHFFMGTLYDTKSSLKIQKFALEKLIRLKGFDYYSKSIDSKGLDGYALDMMKKGYITKKWEWLTSDPQKQQIDSLDLKLAKRFTVGGYYELLCTLEKAQDKKTMELMNPHVPVYFLAGLMDPVGDYGKGVRKAVDLYKKATDAKITMVFYKGLRHELLQEVNRKEVYRFISEKILL